MPNLSIAHANTVYHRLSKWCTGRRQVSVTTKSWLSHNNRKYSKTPSRHMPC